MKRPNIIWLLTVLFCMNISNGIAQQQVNVNVNLERKIEPMKPIWAWFGYDEPNYTYMKDGKKLLTDLANLSPVPVYLPMWTAGNGGLTSFGLTTFKVPAHQITMCSSFTPPTPAPMF